MEFSIVDVAFSNCLSGIFGCGCSLLGLGRLDLGTEVIRFWGCGGGIFDLY